MTAIFDISCIRDFISSVWALAVVRCNIQLLDHLTAV